MSLIISHFWKVFGTNVTAVCVCPQSADVCEQILRVVSRSGRLEELVLDNAGLKTWGYQSVLKLSAYCRKSVPALIWVYIYSNLHISRELSPLRINTNTHTHTHVHDCGWTCIMKAVFDAPQWFCSEVGCSPGPQPQLRSHHPQSCQQPTGGQRYQYPLPFRLIERVIMSQTALLILVRCLFFFLKSMIHHRQSGSAGSPGSLGQGHRVQQL